MKITEFNFDDKVILNEITLQNAIKQSYKSDDFLKIDFRGIFFQTIRMKVYFHLSEKYRNRFVTYYREST